MAASRRILLAARAIEAGKVVVPAAWNYYNLIGEIWLADPTGDQGGGYFNRT